MLSPAVPYQGFSQYATQSKLKRRKWQNENQNQNSNIIPDCRPLGRIIAIDNCQPGGPLGISMRFASQQSTTGHRHSCIYRDLCRVRLTGCQAARLVRSAYLAACISSNIPDPARISLPLSFSALVACKFPAIGFMRLLAKFALAKPNKSPKFQPITPVNFLE